MKVEGKGKDDKMNSGKREDWDVLQTLVEGALKAVAEADAPKLCAENRVKDYRFNLFKHLVKAVLKVDIEPNLAGVYWDVHNYPHYKVSDTISISLARGDSWRDYVLNLNIICKFCNTIIRTKLYNLETLGRYIKDKNTPPHECYMSLPPDSDSAGNFSPSVPHIIFRWGEE